MKRKSIIYYTQLQFISSNEMEIAIFTKATGLIEISPQIKFLWIPEYSASGSPTNQLTKGNPLKSVPIVRSISEASCSFAFFCSRTVICYVFTMLTARNSGKTKTSLFFVDFSHRKYGSLKGPCQSTEKPIEKFPGSQVGNSMTV